MYTEVPIHAPLIHRTEGQSMANSHGERKSVIRSHYELIKGFGLIDYGEVNQV